MRKWLTIFCVMTLCFTLLLPISTALAKPVDVKQEYLVQFHDSVNKGLLKAFGVKDQEILHEYSLLPVNLVQLSEDQAKNLAKNPHIKAVESNAEVQKSGQTTPWGVAHVQGTNAHQAGYTGLGVKVAILDTGIDKSHMDLTANVAGGYSVFTDDANQDPFYDGSGHGTHVAGTAAALNNETGVIGVAHNAQLFSVKVLDNNGSGSYAGIAKGIEWSVINNMKIINMSLGGSMYSSILEEMCQRAHDSGLLLVAAAGNSGNNGGKGDNVSYPARFPSVVAVAAINKDNKRASFSSTGPAVELSAPGVGVLSTSLNNQYASYSGTSMASPHVAGAAALAWSIQTELTNVELRNLLNQTALNLGTKNQYGSGLVQALEAINGPPSNSEEEPVEEPIKPGNRKSQ